MKKDTERENRESVSSLGSKSDTKHENPESVSSLGAKSDTKHENREIESSLGSKSDTKCENREIESSLGSKSDTKHANREIESSLRAKSDTKRENPEIESSFSSKEDTCHIHGNGHRNCVSLVPIFNHLESSQMDDIMTVVQHRTFKKGEMLYHAGEKADALYIVHQGLVKIYRLSESGKEQLVRILNSGDFTGELAIFQDDVQETFAEAIQDTNICVIYRDDLQRFLLKYPTISLKILQEFSHRLDTSEKQTMQFATEKVELRIAHFLVENLSKHGEDTNSGKVELPMSKRDLASYLGTTPETLSRRLTELEETGLIQQKGQRSIQVLDADALLLI